VDVAVAAYSIKSLMDIVAKVENRTTLKISRRSIFRETIWSLTSPRVKRISGSKNFHSSPQKDFCNGICPFGPLIASARVDNGGGHLAINNRDALLGLSRGH
jgi:hypothetical protein